MGLVTIGITREEVRHLSQQRPFIHLRKCLIVHEGVQISFKELPHPSLNRRYTGVKLILEGRFINRRLHLPANVEKAIVWYLNHYPNARLDDERFAFRVAGIQSAGAWKLRRTRKPRVGDHIFFMKEKLIAQKAIYIGAKLCLMVWEEDGPLEVTGIHDIKQALGATHLATWHPNE